MASAPPIPPRLLVTGASGFIGQALARRLGSFPSLAISRRDWREALARCDFDGVTVIHLAARVHDPGAKAADFEADNVEKTRALVEMAAARRRGAFRPCEHRQGVRRGKRRAAVPRAR